jgi:hypothetical protein
LLGEALQSVYIDEWAIRAVKSLTNERSTESIRQAARIFGNPQLATAHVPYRTAVLRACFAAGMKEPLAYYRKCLDDETVPKNEYDPDAPGIPNAHAAAAEIVEHFAPEDLEIRRIVAEHPAIAARIAALKKWLDDRSAKPAP